MLRALLILSTLALAPAVALADGPPDPETMSQRLSDKLGVDVETADAIAAIVVTSHQDATALRQQAREQAEALKAALDAGDTKAMKRAMNELDRIQDAHRDLQNGVNKDVEGLLTVEQQAQWTLFHLGRHARRERAIENLRMLQLHETL